MPRVARGQERGRSPNYRKTKGNRPDFNDAPGHVQRARLHTLEDVDLRSRAYKHSQRLIRRMSNDLGGADNLTHLQADLIQRSVMLTLLMDDMQSRHMSGEEQLPVGKYIMLVKAQNQLAQTLGLKRVMKDATPDVDTYLERKRLGHVEDAELVEDDD